MPDSNASLRLSLALVCRWVVLAAFAGLAASCASRTSQQQLTVFAAASLTDAMDVIADSFRIETGVSVRVNLAASSVLARQIESGARTDLFISADPSWGQYLTERGSLVSARELRITSHLVLVQPVRDRASNADRLTLESSRRLAIGDPAHVPAGKYAREWMECMNVWGLLENRIIPTIDVRAALAYVTTGAADAAIVYSSDTYALVADQRGEISRLDDECQPAITYGAYATRSGNVEWADAFLEYLSSPARRDTWLKLGFEWR